MFPGQQVSGDTFTPNYEWLIQTDQYEQRGVKVLHTSADATGAPTTTLRSGLTMAQLTATKVFEPYVAAGAGGQETAKGILFHPIRLKDAFGAAAVAPVFGTIVIRGRIRAAKCHISLAGALLSTDAAALVELRAQGFLIEEDFE